MSGEHQGGTASGLSWCGTRSFAPLRFTGSSKRTLGGPTGGDPVMPYGGIPAWLGGIMACGLLNFLHYKNCLSQRSDL